LFLAKSSQPVGLENRTPILIEGKVLLLFGTQCFSPAAAGSVGLRCQAGFPRKFGTDFQVRQAAVGFFFENLPCRVKFIPEKSRCVRNSGAVRVFGMADDDFETPEIWDEYQWERFLQQQDRNTEKYFGLLEKYLDHPDRDNIIAKEMGWESFDEGRDAEWDEVAESLCEEEMSLSQQEPECSEGDFEEFARSPIYQDTLKLHTWINSWLDREQSLKDHPEAIRLATRSAVCGAKLAAALCGDDCTELGMTIAYLKRGLKAANDALDAAARLAQEKKMAVRQRMTLNKLLFKVRDRIVDLMSEYRAEWRKRYGNS
jgi:hypothetical protein